MFSILRNNKKGALELSMNAIVIIVLAFAMLGLGLVFTRTLLNQATQGAGQVTDTAKQQILDSLREGNKKLSVQQEVKMGTSDSNIIGVGLKNTLGTDATFTISVIPSGSATIADGLVKDGTKEIGTFTFSAVKNLGAEDADVIPIRFSSKTTAGTKLYTVNVTYGSGTAYATADVFITIQ